MSGRPPSAAQVALHEDARIQFTGVLDDVSPGRQLEVSCWDSACEQTRSQHACELAGIPRIYESDRSVHAGPAAQLDILTKAAATGFQLVDIELQSAEILKSG